MVIHWYPNISGNGFDILIKFLNGFSMNLTWTILNDNWFDIILFCGYILHCHPYTEGIRKFKLLDHDLKLITYIIDSLNNVKIVC